MMLVSTFVCLCFLFYRVANLCKDGFQEAEIFEEKRLFYHEEVDVFIRIFY